ncbi:hypothetical protein BD311DRAFT_750394 [Dichomitus squalens]|uniref:Uncharacterized protein n=1 Tax=Dichomitus squalens TaxID=114155 RepID=A0A4Q9N154_9APHY|nr:hypothetical protein BD311DRAFT_750394 [Dichomitus squalens]
MPLFLFHPTRPPDSLSNRGRGIRARRSPSAFELAFASLITTICFGISTANSRSVPLSTRTDNLAYTPSRC